MNQKRYWLRGGIISIIAFTILGVVGSFVGGNEACIPNPDIGKVIPLWCYIEYLGLPILIPAYYLAHLFDALTDTSTPLLQALFYLVLFTPYFILGALIGWIYGKIKNKNQHSA